MSNYVQEAEGLRVVDTGQSKIKIVLDRNSSLWGLETDAGQLPVALRGQKYTSHGHAFKAVKNYLDGHAERKVVYKAAKKPTE